MNSKVYLIDIETTPIVGYTWGLYEQNVIDTKDNWYILSYAWKELGSKTTHVVKLPDFKGYSKNKSNDKELCKSLWELMNEADVIIAHNGNSFDIKKINARLLTHGFTPPKPYKTIDTKLVAKRYFKFDSNSLDNLGRYLGLGRKIKHSGFELWLGCMSGDTKSWAEMARYNKQDVVLLEQVYLKLRGWDKSHPNMNLLNANRFACPACKSLSLQKRGTEIKTGGTQYQRYQCQSCGKWSHSLLEKENSIIR